MPIFKNYVFVQVKNNDEQRKVLQLDGVVNYVRYLGKPSSMRNEEIELLKEMERKYNHFEVISITPGKVV